MGNVMDGVCDGVCDGWRLSQMEGVMEVELFKGDDFEGHPLTVSPCLLSPHL